MMHIFKRCHSRTLIIYEFAVKIEKLNRLDYRAISMSAKKCQKEANQDKDQQKFRILNVYKIFPLKLKSLKPKKEINIDLNVRIVYRQDWLPKDPVVVALHGMPGDSTDFEKLSYQLAEKNVKFITPDFPGCGKSRIKPEDLYDVDYSPTGKVDMLTKIFDKLELDRVDVLVSHSAGSFLGFRAAADLDRIKAAAFINFLGGKPHRYARPLSLIQLANKMAKIPALQPFFISILPRFYLMIGFARYDAQPLQVAIENVSTAEYKKILDHVTRIKEQEKPTFFGWASTDKILETEIPLNIIKHVGITEPHIINLCRENRIKEKDVSTEGDFEHFGKWYFKAIQYDRGGHLLQKTQTDELTQHIMALINYERK